MRRRARAVSSPALAIALVAGSVVFAVGCTEDPSYQLSWRLASDPAGLDDPASNPELTAVSQCSEVGIAKLEVTTRDGKGDIVDVSRYPCFPSVFADGLPTDGPLALEPGEYTLEVQGLRRTGEPWTCDEDGPDPCVARAHATVSVAEGQLPEVEVVLLAPPQCDDGVDNDLDGRVDGHDPACLLDPTANEDFDAGAVVFQLTATFLDHQVVAPPDVRVTSLVGTVDGEELFTLNTAELDPAFWPYRLPVLSERYEPGMHTLAVVGIGQDGEARTAELVHEFSVNDEQAGFVLHQLDFSADQFLESIVEPFSLIATLERYPGAGATSLIQGCKLSNGEPTGDMRIRVRDTDDQIVDLVALGMSVDIVDDGDGWVRMDCPVAPFSSGALTWGAYTMEAEVLVGETVCFADAYDVTLGPLDPVEPAPLAPKGSGGEQNLRLERVATALDGGGWDVPAECVECATSSDCTESSNLTCVDGLCVQE